MTTAILIRRDTASNWTSNDPTLAAGELGLETDTASIKIGDGSTAWSELPYSFGSAKLIGTITWTDAGENNTLDLSGASHPNANVFVVTCQTGSIIYYIANAPDHEFIIIAGNSSTSNLSFGFVSGYSAGAVKPVYPIAITQASSFSLTTAGLTEVDMNDEYVICNKKSNGTIDVEPKNQWRD